MKFPNEPLRISDPPASISTIHLQRDPDRPHVYQQAPGLYSGCATCGGGWRLTIHLEPLGGWYKEDTVTIDKTADVKPEKPEDDEELDEEGKPIKIKSPTVDKTGDVKEKRD